jgi:superfamily II DNA/RNA helicase
MNNTKPLKDVLFKLEVRGIKAIELHGDLGKLARSSVLKNFKEDLGKLARSTVLRKFKGGEFRFLVMNEFIRKMRKQVGVHKSCGQINVHKEEDVV